MTIVVSLKCGKNPHSNYHQSGQNNVLRKSVDIQMRILELVSFIENDARQHWANHARYYNGQSYEASILIMTLNTD